MWNKLLPLLARVSRFYFLKWPTSYCQLCDSQVKVTKFLLTDWLSNGRVIKFWLIGRKKLMLVGLGEEDSSPFCENCWKNKFLFTRWLIAWVQQYQCPHYWCCCCCEVTSVVSESVRLHRRQPTRLPRPWDSPGKNTGVGCHFLLQCMKVKSESEVVQSCLTPSDPKDCSPPGSSIHGIFQSRVPEWGAIAFSNYWCYNKTIWEPR